MSDLSKKIAFENLLLFKKIATSLYIPFWLDGGTLLGAYRDKDFCRDDEDDIDLGCWDFSFLDKREIFIEEMIENGFKIYHEWKWQIAFIKDGMKIDFFIHRKIRSSAVHLLYGKNINSEKYEEFNGVAYKYIPGVVRASFFERLENISFKGTNFFIPAETEKYLELKYGDWKKPVHRREYNENHGCYDPKYNKVLRPNYEI